MKKYFLFLLMAVPFLFTACDEDDTTNPNIVIIAPADGAEVGQGSDLSPYVQFSDNESLSNISVKLEGQGVTVIDVNESTSGTDFTVNQTVSLPIDQPIGDYTMTVTATDGAGNTNSLTRKVVVTEVCNPLPACQVDNEVTIVLSVPSDTPVDDDIHIVGSFNGWNQADQDQILNRSSFVDNCYCISVPFQTGEEIEFKFTRNGDWGNVEKTADCEEVENRKFTYDADAEEPVTELRITVEAWADIDGC